MSYEDVSASDQSDAETVFLGLGGNAAIGAGGLILDGNGDFAGYTPNAAWNLGTGPYVVETFDVVSSFSGTGVGGFQFRADAAW